MPGDSNIEWTETTWNPTTGCSKVSPGCAHCYAETLTRRHAAAWKVPDLPWTPQNAVHNVILHPERLEQPLRWKKPRMIFVDSMSDLFHELIPDDYIAGVFEIMASAPRHTFQVLTKRPERMAELVPRINEFLFDNQYQLPLPNVWLGTSIENRRYVHRADLLRKTPAVVRFISAEPLIGPLIAPLGPRADGYPAWWTPGYSSLGSRDIHYREPGLELKDIDWLIVGGESGSGHRPMNLVWVYSLLRSCRVSGTAFFFKQLGGFRPGGDLKNVPEDLRIREYPQAKEVV